MDENEFAANQRQLAWHYIGAKDFERASKAAREALASLPDDEESLYIEGLASLRLGQADAAEHASGSLLRTAPDAPPSHFLAGLVLFDRKSEAHAAEQHFRTAIRLAPEQPAYFAALARFLATRRRVEEGITVARKGLRIDPESGTLLECLQMLYRLNDEPRLADAFAQKALARDAESAEAHLEAGLAFLEKGKVAESRQNLRSSLRINPVDTDAKNAIAHERVRNMPLFKNGYFLSFSPGILVPALLVPVFWLGLSLLFRPFVYLTWASIAVLALAYAYHGLFLLLRRRVRRRIDRGQL